MTETVPESLTEVLDEVPTVPKTLLVVNRTQPAPFQRLLDRAFEQQDVRIAERQIPEGTDDLVLLIDNGEVRATTAMDTLSRSFLQINTDSFRTSGQVLDDETVPDVLAGLSQVEFSVRGYPASDKEKLLLVLISRLVEGRALTVGEGRFDVSFQELSRLDDEYGTRRVYERLADSDVEVHVYGVRDRESVIVDDLDVTVHTGTSDEYRDSWTAVYTPPPETAAEAHIALVALETELNTWRACWTYSPDCVTGIQTYVAENF